MLSEAKVYVDGVALSTLRFTGDCSGVIVCFSFGDGVFLGSNGGDWGEVKASGAVCGQVVGLGPSTELALLRRVGDFALVAGFRIGNGSLGLYCGSGEPIAGVGGDLERSAAV